MNRRDFLKAFAALPLTLLGKSSHAYYYVEPKIASYWIKKDGNAVQCENCPHACVLKDGQRGFCRVRENRGGKLYTLSYGNPCAVHIDPIEKKPLFHFLPGTMSYSIATVGCNFRCSFCQNWDISQVTHIGSQTLPGKCVTPSSIVQRAVNYKCASISYTYTEPTIFFEYAHDTARRAQKEGLKNIFVTNGYQTATMNWQTFSQVAFTLRVTPELLVGGTVYALLMGFLGGLFPAIRAARLPVAVALRRV